MKINGLLLLFLIVFSSCRNSNHATIQIEDEIDTPDSAIRTVELDTTPDYDSLPQEYQIKAFLEDDLKDDIPIMSPTDRKYQFEEVDLNGDSKNEIFIQLTSPYFCGTGGCTYVLLSSDYQLITKFSVTRPPIFVEKKMVNGWKTLLLKSEGQFKELVFNPDTNSYPDNPSVVEDAPFEAPSASAIVLFEINVDLNTFEF